MQRAHHLGYFQRGKSAQLDPIGSKTGLFRDMFRTPARQPLFCQHFRCWTCPNMWYAAVCPQNSNLHGGNDEEMMFNHLHLRHFQATAISQQPFVIFSSSATMRCLAISGDRCHPLDKT